MKNFTGLDWIIGKIGEGVDCTHARIYACDGIWHIEYTVFIDKNKIVLRTDIDEDFTIQYFDTEIEATEAAEKSAESIISMDSEI